MILPGQKFGYSSSRFLRGKSKDIFKCMIDTLRVDGDMDEAIEIIQEQRRRNSLDRRVEKFRESQSFTRFDIMEFE